MCGNINNVKMTHFLMKMGSVFLSVIKLEINVVIPF